MAGKQWKGEIKSFRIWGMYGNDNIIFEKEDMCTMHLPEKLLRMPSKEILYHNKKHVEKFGNQMP